MLRYIILDRTTMRLSQKTVGLWIVNLTQNFQSNNR
jgi:hypothetical protein